MKLLEEIIKGNTHDQGLGEELVDMRLHGQSAKGKCC